MEYKTRKFGEYCRFIPDNPKYMEKIEPLEKEVTVLNQDIQHMKDHIHKTESPLKMK